jgi:hypothetical protein
MEKNVNPNWDDTIRKTGGEMTTPSASQPPLLFLLRKKGGEIASS